jgi:hypothetical protein
LKAPRKTGKPHAIEDEKDPVADNFLFTGA